MQIDSGVLIGGKYLVEHQLGRGGMGTVWAARHVRLGNAVAIKVLDGPLAFAPGVLARFEREARATALLETAHVVRMYDCGAQDGTPYLIMELLRGVDLATRLRERGRLPLSEVAALLAQMARGLQCAHQAKIVHRDLKPANLFLCQSDPDAEEVLKILDFGVARDLSARLDPLTKQGEILGSPHYMSPEQASGEALDHRTDLWSTGIILYRMLTGRLPFHGERAVNVVGAVIGLPFPPLAEVAPDLSAGMQAFFEQALAKEREARFSSIQELSEAFARLAAATPHHRPCSPAGDSPAPPAPLRHEESARGSSHEASDPPATKVGSLVSTGPTSTPGGQAPSSRSSAGNVTAQAVSRPIGVSRRGGWSLLGGLGLCLGIALPGWWLTRRSQDAGGATSFPSALPAPPAPAPAANEPNIVEPTSAPSPAPAPLVSSSTPTPAHRLRPSPAAKEDVYDTAADTPAEKSALPEGSTARVVTGAPTTSSSHDVGPAVSPSSTTSPEAPVERTPVWVIPEYEKTTSRNEAQK